MYVILLVNLVYDPVTIGYHWGNRKYAILLGVGGRVGGEGRVGSMFGDPAKTFSPSNNKLINIAKVLKECTDKNIVIKHQLV